MSDIDLGALANELRDADNRLYGMAVAAGIVHHVTGSHPVVKASGRAAGRVGYETARDLAFDAARIGSVGMIVQWGFIEVTPLVALLLLVLLAAMLRLVIAHVGEA